MRNFVENLCYMKKTFGLLIGGVAIVAFNSCSSCNKEKKQEPSVNKVVSDSVPENTAVDSTVWGRLGEGTSMHMIEFIPENSDSAIMIRRSSPETGEDGNVLGDIELTDQFAITINNRESEEECYINTCINVTELRGVWKNGKDVISLNSDNTADYTAGQYNGWKLMNGKLLLTRKVTTEYTEIENTDTVTILYLDKDSLKFMTRNREIVSFGKK